MEIKLQSQIVAVCISECFIVELTQRNIKWIVIEVLSAGGKYFQCQNVSAGKRKILLKLVAGESLNVILNSPEPFKANYH